MKQMNFSAGKFEEAVVKVTKRVGYDSGAWAHGQAGETVLAQQDDQQTARVKSEVRPEDSSQASAATFWDQLTAGPISSLN